MRKIATVWIIIILFTSALIVQAQTDQNHPLFEKIKILQQDGSDTIQTAVVVSFFEDEMTIRSKGDKVRKTFKYSDITSAEYSYSKSPRWKTGLGLGAASLLFPPLLLVAIPIGFTKHRRHWLTIRTENDYAVLKLSKGNRKVFMPTFETKAGVMIKAVGDDK